MVAEIPTYVALCNRAQTVKHVTEFILIATKYPLLDPRPKKHY